MISLAACTTDIVGYNFQKGHLIAMQNVPINQTLLNIILSAATPGPVENAVESLRSLALHKDSGAAVALGFAVSH